MESEENVKMTSLVQLEEMSEGNKYCQVLHFMLRTGGTGSDEVEDVEDFLGLLRLLTFVYPDSV